MSFMGPFPIHGHFKTRIKRSISHGHHADLQHASWGGGGGGGGGGRGERAVLISVCVCVCVCVGGGYIFWVVGILA